MNKKTSKKSNTGVIAPTYGDLFEAAQQRFLLTQSNSGKTDRQVQNKMSEYKWAIKKFCEIANIITPAEHLDARVVNKVTMEKHINLGLQGKRDQRKKVKTLMTAHVRPVALTLVESAQTYQKLSGALKENIKKRKTTAKSVAAAVGMDYATLRSWINYDRLPLKRENLENLAAIEKLLKLEPTSLLSYVNGPRATQISQIEHDDSFLTLSETLTYHMKLCRHNITSLSEKVKVSQQVMSTWINKGNVPRSTENVEVLARCEVVLNVPQGTFTRFTDRRARYLKAQHNQFGMTKSNFKLVRPHLPDNFDEMSPDEQSECVQWASMHHRRPLDKDDDGGDRTPYRCQFAGVAHHAGFHDGVFFAPFQLQVEYDALIKFQTIIPHPVGVKRHTPWAKGSVSARTSALGMFFGGLREVEKGINTDDYSLVLATDIALVRKVTDHLIKRRGRATNSILFLLTTLARIFNPVDGFFFQHRDVFAEHHSSLPEGKKYVKLCKKTHKALYSEIKRRREQIVKGRYSHRALNVVLRADRPMDEYFKIVQYIDYCRPLQNQQPLEWARNVRDSLLLHFLLVMPLRRKNCANLLIQTEDREPPTYHDLARKGMAIVYRRSHSWRIRIPQKVLKNRKSSATSDIDVELVDWAGLYERIELYIEAREILLHGGLDFGQFFVKDNSQPSSDDTRPLSAEVLSNNFLNIISKYGIYNPYKKTGAIEGLYAHRIHGIRHLVATHLMKTNDAETAAARLFDTVKMILEIYSDYQPVEKFAKSDEAYGHDPRFGKSPAVPVGHKANRLE